MPSVVLSAYNVANFPEGGGHCWVYMQYVLGLRQCGCEVYWLERYLRRDDGGDDARLETFFGRMAAFGLKDKVILVVVPHPKYGRPAPPVVLGIDEAEAEAVMRRADLLLNFHYEIDPALLARFRRTALVDIDPGLLQFWISRGQLAVPPHDVYFTTGERLGPLGQPPPDPILPWKPIRPAVHLDSWPVASDAGHELVTTVSTWDGGQWLVDGAAVFENTKRMSFLRFRKLPRLTRQPLELALFLRTEADDRDRRLMERCGWRIRHSREVAGRPEEYRAYIQRSRAEFSCAKPSYVRFQNAWVSDRTVCYLASGKPVVVQDTGPSDYLPNGEGMFRFTTLEEAAAAIAAINADYGRHSRAARGLAEAAFDARRVTAGILEHALG